ncbi:hypothetical protein Tco_0454372 [Tanacetum coccineum]
MFDRLDVWELVPPPDCAMIIALKWIYKVKLDEYGDVLKKTRHALVTKGYRQEEDTMADMNIPANDAPVEQAPTVAPPTRTDDQILPLSNCQLDEQWFNLHKDILRDALNISPANDNNPFVALPSSDTVIEYVNTLGYHITLRNVLAMSVNALYQPWRAILSMIIHVPYSKMLYMTGQYEESSMACMCERDDAHLLIPSVRFTKLIIHHLRTKHNIHPRTGSPLYYSHEESILNTLRFVGKDGREIFGMPIPDALLTDEIKGEKEHAIWDVDKAKAIERLDWAVDLLKHTNFFRAFTTSSAIPAIYIQQFRDTIRYNKIAGSYKCQLDEQWFDLSKDTLRDALQITPVDRNNAFSSPPTPDALSSYSGKEESHSYCDPEYKVHQADLLLLHKASTVPRWRHVLLLHLPNEELFWIISKLPLEGTNGKSLGCLFRMISSRMTFERSDSRAPKPTKGAKPKTTKKPTSTQQTKPKTKPSTAKTTKSTPSQPPKPKPAPAKPQEKKRKRALDAAEAPSQAKRSKAGRVSKKRTLQLRDEFIDEGVPATEPRVDDEEAIVQKVLEESMKDAYPAHRGPLPPVVFREPDSGKLQPLPEVQGKGKEKRRTPATAEPSGLVESSSLYAELGLTDSGTESDEEVSPEMNAQGQEEGQGGTNPGDAGVSQTPSSHVVHAGPNLDHMDLGITEASSQPNTEQMDDDFTATAYPKVQENLKLPTEVTNRFTLIVLSALRRSDKENRQVGPHGSEGSSKDGDGDTSFQWSQFTTPCSHLMFLINDIMTTERPTTQLPQL